MIAADLNAFTVAVFGLNCAYVLVLRLKTKGFRVDVYLFTPRHDVTRVTAMGKGGDVRLKKAQVDKTRPSFKSSSVGLFVQEKVSPGVTPGVSPGKPGAMWPDFATLVSMSNQDELSKASTLLAAIKAFPDPRRASAEWKQVYQVLKKTPAAGSHLDNLVAGRDVTALEKTIVELRASSAIDPSQLAEPAIDDATLRAALKGFKRRLKLVRLDDESRIDLRDPTTKGGSGEIAAIEPPRDWPGEVWTALAARGCLRRSGGGMFEFIADLPA